MDMDLFRGERSREERFWVKEREKKEVNRLDREGAREGSHEAGIGSGRQVRSFKGENRGAYNYLLLLQI